MCQECRTGICAMFDAMVRDYFREFWSAEEEGRPKYMPLDVRNAPESAATKTGFADMASAADGIGLTRMEFLAELSKRSGFGEAIMGWAKGKIPNGLARKIILTCAEDILKERGARPEMSMQQAA